MARHKRGSTPKLTPELIQKISVAIAEGIYIEKVVVLCGISKDTFYRWLKDANGRQSTPLLRELSDSVKNAFAKAGTESRVFFESKQNIFVEK